MPLIGEKAIRQPVCNEVRRNRLTHLQLQKIAFNTSKNRVLKGGDTCGERKTLFAVGSLTHTDTWPSTRMRRSQTFAATTTLRSLRAERGRSQTPGTSSSCRLAGFRGRTTERGGEGGRGGKAGRAGGRRGGAAGGASVGALVGCDADNHELNPLGTALTIVGERYLELAWGHVSVVNRLCGG